ncbi:UvrD-helicase domain-containing protein [Nocardioides sp. GY 10127]|uniref:UvrD-helicase domain-containing protein n=1 Tax=Nocardioides sp. GY 10127 TaxID=2569762 RepID=UPI0010A80C0C|nr:UvrD-helicase domain-containing protein [Nocardioides sp. GY 10127]TIC82593.1 exodeoxyribonuclease V subunit beta [Nocardioides sp. GY 10127]
MELPRHGRRSSAPEPFDAARGPLPAVGTTLLEASAGTGKTWTIGALVTRMVAEEGVALERMLVVTFGRAASQELRERVHAQLTAAAEALAEDAPEPPEDAPLLRRLRDAPTAVRTLRRRRLARALADFDAATIATTHQFCGLVLDSLGVAGDTDSRARLVEDLDDLVVEAADDLYLRAFAWADEGPEFGRAEALGIARAAVNDPQSHLLPEAEDPTRSAAALRRASFARAVRAEVDVRKRRLGLLSYDDLLGQLADALEAEDAPARLRMRQRWSVVLVDEFQDTDPVQWAVLDRAFSGHARMVLIGDPKQAIYAFRGGDVHTYLAAAATAGEQRTLATNWRSDPGLVASLGVLLGGAELGDPRIAVHPVEAEKKGSRLRGADGAPLPPLRLRALTRQDAFDGKAATRPVPVGKVRERVWGDLAADVHGLLASGATWDGRPVVQGDVAVICHRHADLQGVQAALDEVGIRAVVAGGGSLFLTPAARAWTTLLEALEQPHRSTRVRSAALTPFLGYSAEDLDAGGESLTDTVADRLRGWAELVARRGVAAVLESAGAARMPERVLAREGGERLLTDLRHLGEVLHEVAQNERLGVVTLLAWLRREVVEAESRSGGDERTRRLDSDASAVQLVTIHASKGLEYPVVYLPSLADRFVSGKQSTARFHDERGRRCLDVGGAGGPSGAGGWDANLARAKQEDAGESLRLAYVAATRAQGQVVLWWAPTTNTMASPLHRLLSRAPGAAEVRDAPSLPTDEQVVPALRAWQEQGGPVLERALVAEVGALPPEPSPGTLSARTFDRVIDAAWRRTSYSALAHGAETGPLVGGLAEGASVSAGAPVPLDGVGSEPDGLGHDVLGKDDESDPVGLSPTRADAEDPTTQVLSPMAGLPVGATFGSLVHAVLEHADPAAPDHGGDLRAELAAHVAEQRGWWPVELDADELVDALVAVCDTPLGPVAEERTLRSLGLRDRLREMDFELPLAGGDTVRGDDVPRVLLADLAPLLRRHLPADDPVGRFADALLPDPSGPPTPLGAQPLRGYLTGSVDVVLRVGTAAEPRYLVVDYKTNWLGSRDEPLTAHAYRPAALVEAMEHSDYPLQALLYAVVLHRFLRWRQPGYDPERHLAGVLYLYLRGLCGPDTPRVDGEPCGVFTWRPPVALLEEMSDLLDGRLAAPAQTPEPTPAARTRKGGAR